MGTRLENTTVAFLTANEGVEQIELTSPWEAVQAEGARAVLIAPEAGPVQAMNHLDKADVFVADVAVDDVEPEEFDAMVLPGGVANPDNLRMVPTAVRLLREFWQTGRPLAVICHAPWMLADAGITEGLRMTSWPSLRTDLRRAGADWTDEEVVIDGNVITSRKPGDLPAFNAALVEAVARKGAQAV